MRIIVDDLLDGQYEISVSNAGTYIEQRALQMIFKEMKQYNAEVQNTFEGEKCVLVEVPLKDIEEFRENLCETIGEIHCYLD